MGWWTVVLIEIVVDTLELRKLRFKFLKLLRLILQLQQGWVWDIKVGIWGWRVANTDGGCWGFWGVWGEEQETPRKMKEEARFTDDQIWHVASMVSVWRFPPYHRVWLAWSFISSLLNSASRRSPFPDAVGLVNNNSAPFPPWSHFLQWVEHSEFSGHFYCTTNT